MRLRAAWIVGWLLASAGCELPVEPAPLEFAPVTEPAKPLELPPAATRTPNTASAPTGPVVCGLHPVVTGPDDAALDGVARKAGLEYPEAFRSVVNTLNQQGRLPDCYLRKRDASAAGWDRGDDLWKVRAGTAIGGDTFYNREGRLPKNGSYVEADIDFDGGRRGARRIVYDKSVKSTGKVWLTVDHYNSFIPLENL